MTHTPEDLASAYLDLLSIGRWSELHNLFEGAKERRDKFCKRQRWAKYTPESVMASETVEELQRAIVRVEDLAQRLAPVLAGRVASERDENEEEAA